ncbi:MAG: hypothetical protein GTO45_12970 [Candidatus Aminicenantes bacterium]|nr:hypothetical protein [Candidatus Aminicenantes bacterium]NIM79696.1 hypothetical protein [Candidatus Aminicenantes bacterium]NIN19022.1 hypothetical protein [Candidatus Aminicenantes bacterium]NIN42924.1 hypothetical protein [Candidatus Aminicenantes bacterium]NIN85661.1 hypothetical protein [Candidatus Aminicenantes bacterium]
MIIKLIRKAVDNLIARYSQRRRRKVLDRIAGTRKDMDDLTDVEKLRKDWDRGNRKDDE